MSKRIPLELIKQLYDDECLTPAEIAKRLDVSRQAVYERFRNHGIPLKTGPSKKDLIDLYLNKNMTVREIADATGYGKMKISNLLDQYQIPRSYRRNSKHKSVAALEVGQRTVIRQESGAYPTPVMKLAKKLGIRVVTRRLDETTFEVIRTPLLSEDSVRAMRAKGMTKTAIAAVYFATTRSIRRFLED